MITYEVTSFIDGLNELRPLLPLHYNELATHKDKVPLDPDYAKYAKLENEGVLIYVTAREGGKLVGYFIGFVSTELHYKQTLSCMMDIFYIAPNHRGKDTGRGLLQFVEEELKRRGVDRWFLGAKEHFSASWLYKQLDFAPIETTYGKWIKE